MNTDRNINLLLKQAIHKLGSHDYRKAIELFDQIIEKNPNHLIALQGRIFCKTLLFDYISPEEIKENLMIDIPSDLDRVLFLLNKLSESFI